MHGRTHHTTFRASLGHRLAHRWSDQRRLRDWYLRGLGGTYFIAFTSLARQLEGLYGKRGILPIREVLTAAKALPPKQRLASVPTVFWLDASDAALVRACRAGQLSSLLLSLGIAPRWTAAASWLLYLSFVSTGRDFLSFQWDALLLENGLHAMVIAPRSRRSARTAERPPWAATQLMRWLAFRLQFESGYSKLASGDRTWRRGTACCYHFETQPLPTRLGWHAHQLPRWVQRLATLGTLAVELGAPFLAFMPRRVRRAGFWLLSGLQAVIAATGNYAFFNLLTVLDNVWLLDDEALPWQPSHRPPARRAPARQWLATSLATVPLAVLAAAMLVARFRPEHRLPSSVNRALAALAPLRSINAYGLFAVMTTHRPEIVIEGSDDGVIWHAYEFRDKPGDLKRPPRLIAPHQPRLDWQMWFAALGPPRGWFVRVLARLLEGSPAVQGLLAATPFADHPPTYVRALLYEYRMTDRETRRRTGAWWQRELIGIYVPPCAAG
ncbi:MAG: lipase maturation factor family protein [Kofleriaceae bacterium]|nr:lipase maturation factor family protein [Kofleriaceae bacterium]